MTTHVDQQSSPLDYVPAIQDTYVEVEPSMEDQRINKLKDKESQVPVQDRWGQARWVPTRMCYCLPSEPKSCNIVMRTRCPAEGADKQSRTKGIMLYATNPNFGKEPVAETTE